MSVLAMSLMAFPAVAFAQRNIEKLVHKYSDKPYTVYTCIVRRHPRTGKVYRVMKSLSVANRNVYREFESAFRTEGKKADYVNTSRSQNGFSSVLRFEGSSFIFSSDGNSRCTITIMQRTDDGSQLTPKDNEESFPVALNGRLWTAGEGMSEEDMLIMEKLADGLERRMENAAGQVRQSEQILWNFNGFTGVLQD